jgi:hypothetical protein
VAGTRLRWLRAAHAADQRLPVHDLARSNGANIVHAAARVKNRHTLKAMSPAAKLPSLGTCRWNARTVRSATMAWSG